MAICLMYHNIIPTDAARAEFFEEHRPYTVTRERFEGHIEAMREAGATILHPDEAFTERAGEPNAFLLTFDDSWDNREAEEVLAREGLSGIFFLNSGLIGEAQMLKEADVRRMGASGLEIGSHAVTHDFLSMMPTPRLRETIFRSKADLEAIAGSEVRFLSAPGGRYDSRAVRLAREAGYRGFFVSRPGFLRRCGERFVLNRISITADITKEGFQDFIAGPATRLAYRRIRYHGTRLARRLSERRHG